MSENLTGCYKVVDATSGLIRRPTDRNVCDEAEQNNDGVCYEDCAGRLAVFSACIAESDADEDRTQVHVCPRESTVGAPYTATLGAVVIHALEVPTTEQVVAVADDVLSGW